MAGDDNKSGTPSNVGKFIIKDKCFSFLNISIISEYVTCHNALANKILNLSFLLILNSYS